MPKRTTTIASEIGKGLLAGLAGTVAMTIASTVEMKLRRRPPSRAPAEAAGKVLRVQPRDAKGEARFGEAVHFGYGTMWGLARAAIGVGLRAANVRARAVVPPAMHFALVWGTAVIMLPSLGVAPPVHKWGAKEIAIDVFHHAVYVAASDAAYRAL